MALRWAMLLICVQSALASVPATDACRQYGTSCDLCTDFVGCYWWCVAVPCHVTFFSWARERVR